MCTKNHSVAITLIGIVMFTVGVACTAAQQQTAKTTLDAAAAACASNAPQSVAVLVDPQSGEVAQVVCLTEEELARILDPVLAERRAMLKLHAKAGSAPSVVPAGSASTGP